MIDPIPINLGEMFHQELLKSRRDNDFLMHASSHILGSLRHAQLDVAGAPKRTNPLLSEITLMTGTMWHDWMHNTLRRLGVPYMAEVNMTPWLPPGWAGTADAFVWNPEAKAFLLIDFKTMKGEGLRFVIKDGAKDEHKAQASAYWWAAKEMGLRLLNQIAVLYWPKNDTRGDELIEPVMVDFKPIPKETLHATMADRWGKVSDYVISLGAEPGTEVSARPLADWITEALAPEQERVQRLKYDKATGTADVILYPHWSAAYCPFPVELCACSTQGQTKIGMWQGGEYYPRTGYENIEPEVGP
jgi:hypothetical protein